MFKLTYRPSYDRDHSVIEYHNDIKDIGQALINIVNNKKEEASAMKWCSKAQFGDKIIRHQFGYKIECISEQQLINQVKAVADKITKQTRISNQFVRQDNEGVTYSFDLDDTYMKFHDNYGYYMSINICTSKGTPTNIWEVATKNEQKFIEECVDALKEYSKYKANNPDVFAIGKTYIGADKVSQKVSISITNKTPQYIYYKASTGVTGKVKIKHSCGYEAVLIKKLNDLVVISADSCN